MIPTTHRRMMLLASAFAGSLPGSALANDRDLLGTTVPAASCVIHQTYEPLPLNAWSIQGLRLNGALGSIGGFRGVWARCPLPISNVEISNKTSNDNDMSSFRVLYHDADGFGLGSNVAVSLVEVKLVPTGLQAQIVCGWRSNTSGTGSTGFTRATIPCVLDFDSGAFYYFDVSLFPTAMTDQIVLDFAGIDFPK